MEKEYEIIDNLLNEHDFQAIRSLMLPTHGQDNQFQWHWGDRKTSTTDGREDEDSNFQFVHFLYSGFPALSKSSYFSVILPILAELKGVIGLVRIKVNLETNKGAQLKSSFHWDYHTPSESEHEKEMPYPNVHVAIYYVNTNNGYTELEGGTKVKSVANRLLLFPNTMKHRGVSQTDEKRRCVINFNYLKNGLTSGG